MGFIHWGRAREPFQGPRAGQKTWWQNRSGIVLFNWVLSTEFGVKSTGMHSLFLNEHNGILHHYFCCFESTVFTDKAAIAQVTHSLQLHIVCHVYISGCLDCNAHPLRVVCERVLRCSGKTICNSFNEKILFTQSVLKRCGFKIEENWYSA